MKKVIYILLTAFVVGCLNYPVSAKLSRIYVIVNMDDAPVEILAFSKYKYEEENYISSMIEYRNITNRDIEALAITMIYYDAFNEKEDGVRGISTDLMGAGEGYRGTWSTYGEPNFVKTAMAFVDSVRFVDGEIWKADRQEVIGVASKMPELYFLSKTEMLEVEKE